MGLSEDGDNAVETQFEELCLDLNMDKKAKDEALGNYQKMLENYTLEACLFVETRTVIAKHPFFPFNSKSYSNVIYF